MALGVLIALNALGGGLVGTGEVSSDEPPPEPAESSADSIEFEATFYTAGCEGCSGITRTGIDVRSTIWNEGKRIIAVDPSVIPLGTAVIVELANGDTFEAVAEDTGGAIKGRRIDVLVETRDEAYRLGRQKARVTIIK